MSSVSMKTNTNLQPWENYLQTRDLVVTNSFTSSNSNLNPSPNTVSGAVNFNGVRFMKWTAVPSVNYTSAPTGSNVISGGGGGTLNATYFTPGSCVMRLLNTNTGALSDVLFLTSDLVTAVEAAIGTTWLVGQYYEMLYCIIPSSTSSGTYVNYKFKEQTNSVRINQMGLSSTVDMPVQININAYTINSSSGTNPRPTYLTLRFLRTPDNVVMSYY